MNKTFSVLYRLGFGSLALIAVASQLFSSLNNNADFNIINFFSFFTILSNLLAAGVLLIFGLLLLLGKTPSRLLEMLRGAATLYMVTTGIVYFLLLRGTDVQVSHPWINNVLHYGMPWVMLGDWLLVPPQKSIAFKQALLWLTFPFLYLGYSLVRGEITEWYPYPFLDAANSGYIKVVFICLAILVGLLIFIRLLVIPIKVKRR